MNDFLDAFEAATGIGAFLTLGIALIGSVIGSVLGPFLSSRWQEKSERARFVREQTLELDLDLMRFANTWEIATDRAPVAMRGADDTALGELYEDTRSSLEQTMARVDLLSPQFIRDAYNEAATCVVRLCTRRRHEGEDEEVHLSLVRDVHAACRRLSTRLRDNVHPRPWRKRVFSDYIERRLDSHDLIHTRLIRRGHGPVLGALMAAPYLVLPSWALPRLAARKPTSGQQ